MLMKGLGVVRVGKIAQWQHQQQMWQEVVTRPVDIQHLKYDLGREIGDHARTHPELVFGAIHAN